MNLKRIKLQQLRKENDLTQKEVAEMLGITSDYYGMIERGERTGPLEIAKKISDLFGTTVEDIFFTY